MLWEGKIRSEKKKAPAFWKRRCHEEEEPHDVSSPQWIVDSITGMNIIDSRFAVEEDLPPTYVNI